MTSLFVGIYGVFFLAAGIQGNGNKLFALLAEDGRKFIPWLFAIVVISVLSEFEATEKLVKPFAVLLALNFFLRNFATLQSEAGKIFAASKG